MKLFSIIAIGFLISNTSGITLTNKSQDPAILPPRTKKPFPTPSKIVKGEIPEGVAPIQAAAKGPAGPTYEYGFSPDNLGPHKVEVFNEGFKS